jgi:nuclear mRNA export protein SAC3
MAEATSSFIRGGRGFGLNSRAPTPTRGRGRGSKNKHWPPTSGPDNERWERGGHRGGRGRGRGRGNLVATFVQENSHQTVDLPTDHDIGNETEEEQETDDEHELPLDATQKELEDFWNEVRYPQASRPPAIPSNHSLNSLSKLAKLRERERLRKAPWMTPSFQNGWKML